MKTTNNVTKTYVASTSVARWAKKNIGPDWIKEGTIDSNEDGRFFYAPFPKEEELPKIVAKDDIVHKSTIGSPCRVVWDIAESMPDSKRKDVLAECVKQGVAFYTARTQYQKYREALKAAGVSAEVKTESKAA